MKNIKILYNQNKLCNEVSSDACYGEEQNEFSMRLVFSGYEQYIIAKREFNIYPGNFMVINRGTVYTRKIYSDTPSNTFAILFAPGFLARFHAAIVNSDANLLDDPFRGGNETPSFLETIYPFKGHLMYNMMHLKNHFHNSAIEDLLIDDYLHHGLLLFYQLYNREILSKSSRLNISDYRTRTEIFKRVTIAKDFMLSHYNRPITLEDISSNACISAPHLFRTFKQTFQYSPHQYLTQVRLDNARHMLKNTKYPLNEIVSMVGFTCPSTFIKLFKRQFGFTPRHYRLGQSAGLTENNEHELN